MKQFSSYIGDAFAEASDDHEASFVRAIRAGKIRQMWSELVEEDILNHTNGVYVVNEEDQKVLKVYVDESIYAAELNNRRELILLLCKSRYGENLDAFHIIISRGNMKRRRPFKKEQLEGQDKLPSVALDEEELDEVERACLAIPDEALRATFKKAMIADLEWKKGNPQ
ncbi:MAG: DUF721 domain-containing protein [Eggerthellaceae bacterium]|nr:DUF721 domain-containing protein [Eggerthellaceae bacterium]